MKTRSLLRRLAAALLALAAPVAAVPVQVDLPLTINLARKDQGPVTLAATGARLTAPVTPITNASLRSLYGLPSTAKFYLRIDATDTTAAALQAAVKSVVSKNTSNSIGVSRPDVASLLDISKVVTWYDYLNPMNAAIPLVVSGKVVVNPATQKAVGALNMDGVWHALSSEPIVGSLTSRWTTYKSKWNVKGQRVNGVIVGVASMTHSGDISGHYGHPTTSLPGLVSGKWSAMGVIPIVIP
jgi:hypothetical protein